VSEELARRLATKGIADPRVLDALAAVDRARFVPPHLRAEADADRPLPIGFGQTISQPFVVAYMTEQLRLLGSERVLEVGTGSGYQTALLARLAAEVYSIELLPELATRAREVLIDALGLRNVRLRTGDGALGWPEAAPFDRILSAAAAAEVPPAWLEQLAPGGRLLLPLGAAADDQVLRVIDRGNDGRTLGADLLPVRFVPLVHAPGDA
jgi:protein-L-isoaspartate(D-aspartate) O-methyltransferase